MLLLLAGVAFCETAHADEPAGEYPAPCDAGKVSKGDVERAHTVFLSGKQYLEESNYDKAIGYFKDAYSIDCSVHPILPIIATAYERKGDKAAAIRALQEYLRRAPTTPDREVIERRIRNLSDQLAREPAVAPTVVPVPPAPVGGSIAPSAPAAAPTSSASEPAAPTPAAHDSEAVHHTRSPGPWILVGVGAVAIPTGVVLLAAGASQVSSAAKACPSRQDCPSDVASKGNSGRGMETAGGLLLGLGPALVGGGLLWYFLSKESAASDGAITPSLVVAPGYAGAGVGGSF